MIYNKYLIIKYLLLIIIKNVVCIRIQITYKEYLKNKNKST